MRPPNFISLTTFPALSSVTLAEGPQVVGGKVV